MRRHFFIVLLFSIFLYSCSKNTVSKIPHISLAGMFPQDTMTNGDTCWIEFKFIDGDGDIGTIGSYSNDTTSQIYVKDSRFASAGFTGNLFPIIDARVEDPKKGLTGTCDFYPFPIPILRADSLHQATGDTFSLEIYITDRAGNQSNHITTNAMIIRP